jgi:peptidyl-prolyl cis-trans isomerase B (cyclophilin B)
MSSLVFKTRRGEVLVTLFTDAAPITVAHITSLVEQGFYDGLGIHRVVRDQVTQFGCPVGDGSGGAGQEIPDEPNAHRLLTGTLAMANKGPHTASSQFFFCWRPLPSLEGKHTVFGRVSRGIDVLYRLREGDKVASVMHLS